MKGKIIALLSFFVILLIGFFGWGFSTGTFNNIYSKYMINQKYIEINNIAFSDYNEYGFVDDYTVVDYAILSFDINLNYELINNKYNSYIKNKKNLDFEIILSYENVGYKFFDIISNSNIEISSNHKIKENKENNKRINSYINIEKIEEKNISIQMCYKFDVNDYIKKDNFKSLIYDEMINKGIPFKFKAILK